MTSNKRNERERKRRTLMATNMLLLWVFLFASSETNDKNGSITRQKSNNKKKWCIEIVIKLALNKSFSKAIRSIFTKIEFN